MTARVRPFWSTAAAATAAAVAAITTGCGGGGEPYRVHLLLDNASSLRKGVQVRIAGIPAGEVSAVRLTPDDKVKVDVEIDGEHGPIGRDASIAIRSLNLLGKQALVLDKGNVARPAPSGFTFPGSRIEVATDLQQVLDVLDAGTRTRLGILINEAGTALVGRRTDFNAFLRQMPNSVLDVTRLLDELVSDDRTLARLIRGSDRFIDRVAAERRSLARLVGVVADTATTVAARRTRLRETLAESPATLRTLRRFLADLRETTVPLGPAARYVRASAPALSSVLAEAIPFERSAAPALQQAIAVSPSLERLAREATPVLERARPTARSLATFSEAFVPFAGILDRSQDNLLAVVDNWSHAVSDRDGLSHIFRGEAALTTDGLKTLLRRLSPPRGTKRRRQAPAAGPGTDERPARNPVTPTTGGTNRVPRLPDVPRIPDLPGLPPITAIPDALEKVPGLPGLDGKNDSQPSPLLDYLLGE